MLKTEEIVNKISSHQYEKKIMINKWSQEGGSKRFFYDKANEHEE